MPGAATTVLGVIPLVIDAFRVSMALSMALVPAFYTVVNQIVSSSPKA
jgi:hypothetical protein